LFSYESKIDRWGIAAFITMSRSFEGEDPPRKGQDESEQKDLPTAQSATYYAFSRALMNLTFQDRNAISEEIHGVSCMAPDESPEFLDAALYSLSHELNQIEDKSAYNQAQEIYLTGHGQCAYVNTNEFRLRFLRSELFHVKAAATRMVKYLDVVNENFGPHALTRPMHISDLTRDEKSFLRSGYYQILPYRDRSGRRILCIMANNFDCSEEVSTQTRLKVLMYLWLVAGEDVESQRKGLVLCSFSDQNNAQNVLDKKQSDLKGRIVTHTLVSAVSALRTSAVHIGMPDSSFFLSFLTKIYGTGRGPIDARIKIHLGKSVELRYKLQGFGIPVELIPATDTGNVKHENLKQWIKLREYLEKYPKSVRRGSMSSVDSDDSFAHQQYYQQQQFAQYAPQYQMQQQQQQPKKLVIVECPESNDVIFRRGKSMTYHPGNVMFQSMIESRLQEHTDANQAGKMAIVLSLIQYIQQEKGGRFLTWDSRNNWWLDMMTISMSGSYNSPSGIFQAQELEIQSKVGYAFRDFKKKLKKMEQQGVQVSKSSTYAFQRQDGSKRKRTKGGDEGHCMDACILSDSDNTFTSTNFSDNNFSDS